MAAATVCPDEPSSPSLRFRRRVAPIMQGGATSGQLASPAPSSAVVNSGRRGSARADEGGAAGGTEEEEEEEEEESPTRGFLEGFKVVSSQGAAAADAARVGKVEVDSPVYRFT